MTPQNLIEEIILELQLPIEINPNYQENTIYLMYTSTKFRRRPIHHKEEQQHILMKIDFEQELIILDERIHIDLTNPYSLNILKAEIEAEYFFSTEPQATIKNLPKGIYYFCKYLWRMKGTLLEEYKKHGLKFKDYWSSYIKPVNPN